MYDRDYYDWPQIFSSVEDLWSYWEQAIATKGREGRSDDSQSFYTEIALSHLFLTD